MNFATHSAGTVHFDAKYGAAARSIRESLSFHYEYHAGTPPEAWATAIHEGGLVILIPVSSNPDTRARFDAVGPARAFAVATMRTYEAFTAQGEEDDEHEGLLNLLLSSAETANQLAVTQ